MLNLPLARLLVRIQGGTQCRVWLFYSTCFELRSSTKNEIKKGKTFSTVPYVDNVNLSISTRKA
jgi:hypothetical protein